MSKIYIAGPMTGLPEFNRPAFNRVAKELADGGIVPLNPAILPDGLNQPEYMDICLAMLRCADGIMLLDGWKESAGARAEKALAEKLGVGIFFQSDPGEQDTGIKWDLLDVVENHNAVAGCILKRECKS